jgi:methyltransferase (TIGR00027 family)
MAATAEACMERTHDDTWDLATSVGATATMVAAGRARATRAAQPLIDDPFAEPLVRAVGIDFFTRWATGELAAADVDLPGTPWGMQPMTDLLAARTRFFDAFLTALSELGIRQVVILASGLDARGYRLMWPSDTVIYEIDQPDVLSFKAATLAELNATPTADVRTVPVDLRHDWPTALREAGFDKGRPSAWIAEGLLPFLPADAQDRLLDDVSSLSAPGSGLASEVALIADGADDGPLDNLTAITQRWRDNGFDVELGDLGYPGPRHDVADYLDARGWRSVRTPLQELFAATGLSQLPQVDGAMSLGDNYYCTSVRI